MRGTSKSVMKEQADRHFNGLKQIVPEVRRIVLFDYDEDGAYHPEKDNPVLYEWNRKNIENYLIVADAWKRALAQSMGSEINSLFSQLIDEFFTEQNLTLPKGFTWGKVKANIFKVVDGKKILFELEDSLFQRIYRAYDEKINRESISLSMKPDEIHVDIINFFERLKSTIDLKQ
jgi:hypothetical protein